MELVEVVEVDMCFKVGLRLLVSILLSPTKVGMIFPTLVVGLRVWVIS